MEQHQVAIIIPAYNEAGTIEKVVKMVSPCGQAIVVNDCSSDDTALLAERAGAIVVSHENNKGYDGALSSGFAAAEKGKYQYVITFDADGQHDAKLLKTFLDYLQQGYDVVLGVRPHGARFSERLFAFYTRLRFKWKDPLCGMKGYNINLYKEHGCFDSYSSIGTELALYALIHRKRSMQIAVPIAAREDAPRFGQLWRANYKILRAMILSFIKL